MIRRLATAFALAAVTAMLAACAQLPAGENSRSASTAAKAPAGVEKSQQAERARSDEYRLGPGDVVKITVYSNDDLATETEISQGGTIDFPLIGEVKLAGLTRSEAAKAISDRLGSGGFVPNAFVNLLVTEYRGHQVTVIGEVNKPGKYPINQKMRVTDVIAAAGGISPKGSSLITVIRKDANGETQQYRVDVHHVLAGDLSKDFRILSDDIVNVPPAPIFYIYGEVRQPGSYPLATDMTVRQALSVGGGLTIRGTENGIKVERKGSNGKTSNYNASLSDKLRPDDVVYVPEGWF